MDYEYCWICGDATGKAGLGDGSIYDDDGDGPYCENCYGEYLDGQEAKKNSQMAEDCLLDRQINAAEERGRII